MPTRVGATNPNLAKGSRKLKKEKHCTIPKTLNKMKRKELLKRNIIENRKWKKKKPQWRICKKIAPNQVWGSCKDVSSTKKRLRNLKAKC